MAALGNMNAAQQELWSKLEAYAFDPPGVGLTFARRLARENGWTAAFTEKVIREYKRFVFLAMEAGHPVSPSEEVDQAWHLHLTYTESYWQGLCAGILGRRLHHHPTKGGSGEAVKFDGQYQRTLESYRRLFGEAPPPEIWAAAEARDHGKAGGHRWVDTGTHWVIPKWAAWAGAAVAVAGLFLLGSAGCSSPPPGMQGLLDLPAPEFLRFFVALLIASLLLAASVRYALCGPHGNAAEADLPRDNFEIAYLAGGAARVLQTALVTLEAEKAISVGAGDEPAVKQVAPPTRPMHDIEVLIWGQLPADGSSMPLSTIQSALRPAYEKMESSLFQRGLLAPRARLAAWVGLPIALVAPVMGGGWFLLTSARWEEPEHAVLVLILMGLVILSMMAAVFLCVRWCRQRRSGRGSRFIRSLRQQHKARRLKGQGRINIATVPLSTAAAVYGLAVLPAYGYLTLAENLKKSGQNYGSGCGAGGCGASCGGGCGGCGGGCGGGGCGGGGCGG